MSGIAQVQPPVAAPSRRYAIGVFDGWPQAEAFRADMIESGIDPNAVGLFPDSGSECARELRGPFRMVRQKASPSELLAGLESSLLPMHARFLADAVEAGRVLVWVEIKSFDQECRICLGMLKSSGRTVQTHDFGTVGG